MAQKINPSYYAIIPASVRYDDNLTATAKLLYGEVAALCNQEGYCWASNSYFAKLYGIGPKRISELIASLIERGHITSEVDKGVGNTRNLYLAEAIPKNTDRYPEKYGDPIPKNTEHNNTVNSKSNTISAETLDSELAMNIQKIYELYLKKFKLTQTTNNQEARLLTLDQAKKRYKLTPRRREAIRRRLEDAGGTMLAAAIIGYAREPWYQGENDRGWTADLEKFICRSYEKVEGGANKFEAQQTQASKPNDPWA